MHIPAPNPNLLASESIPTKTSQVQKRFENIHDDIVESASRIWQLHNFRTGDKIFLDTINLLIGYANVASIAYQESYSTALLGHFN
jgi:hypothetical protein